MKSRLGFRTCLALVVALALACVPVLAREGGRSVICRQHAFDGLEPLQIKAEQFAKETTTDPNAVVIVLTRHDGEVYLQSNFTSRYSGFDENLPISDENPKISEYPTKIYTNDEQKLVDLRQGMKNILFWGKDPGRIYADPTETLNAAMKNAVIKVDRAALDEHGRPPLDLSGARKIEIIDLDQGVSIGDAELLPVNKPPPSLIQKLLGCCLYGRPPGRTNRIVDTLRAQTIKVSDVGVISMFTDSGTQQSIEAAPLVKAAQNKVASTGSWEQRFENALKTSRGKPLIVFAHTEGESVVVRNRLSQVEATMPIQHLADRAVSEGVQLMIIGCETAKFVDDQSLGLTVIGKYRSTEAVGRLQNALSGSRNAAEFYEALSGEGLRLVVETDEARTATLTKAKVMAKVKRDRPFWVQIGRFIFVKPKANA